jgi:hypothetical protein
MFNDFGRRGSGPGCAILKGMEINENLSQRTAGCDDDFYA